MTGIAPPGIDVSVPNVARMYDYYLGGKDNFASDRAAAEQVLENMPGMRYAARENRGFLQRSVRYLATQGIRQFLDLGAGLPTQGQVHEIAHTVAPGAKVMYVDHDPVVVVHARALIQAPGTVTVLEGDLRQPDHILNHPKTRAIFNWDEPVGVLMYAVMHFIPDEEASGIIAAFRDAMAPGSYLVMSHGTADATGEQEASKAEEVYEGASARSRLRQRQEILPLFEGFEMVDPGLVWLPQWRPEGKPPAEPWRSLVYAGVGRKA